MLSNAEYSLSTQYKPTQSKVSMQSIAWYFLSTATQTPSNYNNHAKQCLPNILCQRRHEPTKIISLSIVCPLYTTTLKLNRNTLKYLSVLLSTKSPGMGGKVKDLGFAETNAHDATLGDASAALFFYRTQVLLSSVLCSQEWNYWHCLRVWQRMLNIRPASQHNTFWQA